MARMTDEDIERIIEDLQVLSGERSGPSRDQAAVRISDLADLFQLVDLESEEVGAAPTQAEYNALHSDLLKMHQRLSGIAAVLRNKLI